MIFKRPKLHVLIDWLVLGMALFEKKSICKNIGKKTKLP